MLMTYYVSSDELYSDDTAGFLSLASAQRYKCLLNHFSLLYNLLSRCIHPLVQRISSTLPCLCEGAVPAEGARKRAAAILLWRFLNFRVQTISISCLNHYVFTAETSWLGGGVKGSGYFGFLRPLNIYRNEWGSASEAISSSHQPSRLTAPLFVVVCCRRW